MDSKIEMALFALGAMYVLFTVGRLINIFCLYREDRGQTGAIDGILSTISLFLMLAGLPVFGIYLLTGRFDIERAERRVRNERLENHYKSISEERQEAYSNGYEDGFSAGEEQFSDFDEIENFSSTDFDEKDISETKEYMAYKLNCYFFDLIDIHQKSQDIPDNLESTHLLWLTFMSIANAPIKHYDLLDYLLSCLVREIYKRYPCSREEYRTTRMKCSAVFAKIKNAFEKDSSCKPHMIAFVPETTEKYAELVLSEGFTRKDASSIKALSRSYHQIIQVTEFLMYAQIVLVPKNNSPEP